MTGMPSAGRDSSQDPVAITALVPRPPHRVSDESDRWVEISRHPEPSADPRPR